MSKISQKVFVFGQNDVVQMAAGGAVAASPPPPPPLPPPLPLKRLQSSDDFHGELRDKCMTFFSSVTR